MRPISRLMSGTYRPMTPRIPIVLRGPPSLNRPFASTHNLHKPEDDNPNDGAKKSSLLDRESMNTEPNEYSKSGSDSKAASGQDDPAAFEPGKNDPESELGSSGGDGAASDPLDASPANKELTDSQVEGVEKGDAQVEKAPDRKPSGGGRGRKNG